MGTLGQRSAHEQGQLLQLILEHAPAALAIFDREMRYLGASRRWIADYRLDETRLEGRSHYEIFPEIPDRWKEMHRRGLAGEVVFHEDDRFERVDGSVQWVRWEIRPWYDADGAVGGIVILTEDLTEGRRADEALAASAAKYQELMETANSIIIRWDHRGTVRYLNEYGERFFGYDPGELVGRDVSVIIPPVDEASGRDLGQLVQEILDHPETHEQVPNQNITKDGRAVWVAWTNKATLGPDGRVSEILAIGNDITPVIRAEQALAQSERQRRLALDAAEMGTWRRDLLHDEVWLDQGARALLGVEWEHGTMHDILTRVHPEDRAALVEGSVSPATQVDDQDHLRMAFRVIHPDGAVHCLEAHARVQYDDTGSDRIPVSSFGTVQDITAERTAAEAQDKLKEELAQAQKMESVGRLAGGVAHDFNNMLGIILGRVELAMDQVEEGSSLWTDMVEISKAATRSADLTRQLLAFARKQPVQPRVVDLNEEMAGMLQMLRRLIGEDIRLSWNPCSAPCTVSVDPSQAAQVLANLCVNARDAIKGVGHIALATAHVEVDPADFPGVPNVHAGPYVRLSVTDDGEGMDPETLANVFEPFFTTKPMGSGTGLGLATVYGIAMQNDGFVVTTSEKGKGSTFELFLPRRERGAVPGERAGAGQAPGGTETILLVEDEEAILDLTATLLRRLGYRVIPAGSPADALEVVKTSGAGIDLLVTDVVMPGMNGEELRREVASRIPEIRTLFMSGYTADVVELRGVPARGTHLLAKPFDISALAHKVRAALEA